MDTDKLLDWIAYFLLGLMGTNVILFLVALNFLSHGMVADVLIVMISLVFIMTRMVK